MLCVLVQAFIILFCLYIFVMFYFCIVAKMKSDIWCHVYTSLEYFSLNNVLCSFFLIGVQELFYGTNKIKTGSNYLDLEGC